MPCDAISTATATVSNEELMKHVDMGTLSEALVAHFEGVWESVSSSERFGGLRLVLGERITITVSKGGKISVEDWRSRYGKGIDEEAMAQEVKGVVEAVAGLLFQENMAQMIEQQAPILERQFVPTDIGDALSLTARLDGILSRVIVLPNGEISVYTDEGTFDEGAGIIKTLFEGLSVEFASVSEPEQHRHDGTDRVHQHLHAQQKHRH